MNNRVKAFTIMEVTITMLVSAILIAITYTSYSIVIKSYRSFTGKNQDMGVLISLDHLLQRDFEQARFIWKDSSGIALQKDSTLVKYEFSQDFVVRIAMRTDTFKVQTQDADYRFEELPVIGLQDSREQNRIDALGFTLLFRDEKISYHYHKVYSSENLIERNTDAIH